MTSAFDIAIVGSGPAGLAAAGQAKARGLRHVVLERAPHLADTVHAYQKRKLVMAEPALVPQLGDLPFEVGPRESVLAGWQRFVEERGIDVRLGSEVKTVERDGSGFRLTTAAGVLAAEKVVVAVGTQGNPRRLGLAGEDQPHVSDRLVDPDAHRGEEIVVVGAGDSALEVALALCGHNQVHLVVRTAEIVRAKEALEREILSRSGAGELEVHFNSSVAEVGPTWVDLKGPEGRVRVGAQRVIKKIGADPPRRLLEGWGVEFDGPGRDSRPRLGPGYESSVPGLHVVGAVTGRDLIRLGINQGHEAVEHATGHPMEPADEGVLRERLPFWSGTVRERIDEIRDAVPLFAGASNEQLREIFLLASPREYDHDEVIVRQNDYTDSLLAVCDGRVRIVQEAGASVGRGRTLAELSSGNFFGEMGLVSGRRRNATVLAVGYSRILEVPRKAMLKLLHLAAGVREVIDRIFLVRALENFLSPGGEESALWKLAGQAELVTLERDQVVFTEGDPSDSIFLVRSGMVKISRRSGDREIVLTYLVAGNYFGENALLEKSRRTATVTTIFPTELIRLSQHDFNRFLEGEAPEVRQRFLDTLEERRVASLSREATPGVGEVLSQLIESEAVIGTDVLLIDNHKCVRCNNCVFACEGVHDDGQARLTLSGDHVANLLLPNSCMQCENPLCMLDCPPDAIVRRPGGEIFIRDSCIGCSNCANNCPYENIFMVQPKTRRSPFDWLAGLLRPSRTETDRVKQEVAVKCDLCRSVAGGPACVRSCPTGAAIRLEPQDPEDLRKSVEVLVDPGALL